MVEWPATRRCVDTTAVIAYLAGQIDQNNENQPVETTTIRVYNFLLYSRLEQCGLGIFPWPMHL